MDSTYVPQGTTTRLTPADLDASDESSRKNIEQKAFCEWPNEAGFDGLSEHRGPIELKLKGTIPTWAAGSLYRTGPGQSKVEDTKSGTFHISHWFDGLAHTHKFDIVAETVANEPVVRVKYSSRRQSDQLAAEIKATGTLRGITFAQKLDPCVGIFGKFMSVFRKPYTPLNVSVTVQRNIPSSNLKTPTKATADTQGHRAPALVLGTDNSMICQIDSETMEPIGFPNQTTFHPDLKGGLSGAHAQFDPETGDYFNYNLVLGKDAVYRIFRVTAATGKTDILAVIRAKGAWIHSFFMTQNYVVLCVPVSHYALNGVKLLMEGNLRNGFNPFDPSETCRWYVVDRRNGKGLVAEFASPARFFFHTVNAFEDDKTGDLLCEVVDYPNRYVIDGFYYDVVFNRDGAADKFWDGQLQHLSFPRLSRYRLRKEDFVTGRGDASPAPQLVMEIPSPHTGDLPTINPNYQCRKHRYAYFVISRIRSTFFDALAKVDTETAEVLQWEGPHGHTPGEAIFVPRPATDGEEEPSEDDGVLLSVVLDGANKMSYLLCLDAKTMTELGRAECEFAVAIGLHGCHLPAA
ncbi:carotenoid cleavage dioxygenase 1 [Chaetomium fimeti]|uniref:Carotenoid cleavage dioxygenase 1 n=1 Tax=Chaetomium fimeti TaxID=1854472 RepID=A0AAE0HAJ3_9PEZI|nr:carotenoid cleavage dioxygenase 1 [Chaetomium fimeti]